MQQIEMSNKLHSERDELLVIDSLACVNIYVYVKLSYTDVYAVYASKCPFLSIPSILKSSVSLHEFTSSNSWINYEVLKHQ